MNNPHSDMTNKNDMPDVEGWYWMDSAFFGNIIVKKVFKRPGHDYLCINEPESCQHVKSDFLAVKKMGAKWTGPIVRDNTDQLREQLIADVDKVCVSLLSRRDKRLFKELINARLK